MYSNGAALSVTLSRPDPVRSRFALNGRQASEIIRAAPGKSLESNALATIQGDLSPDARDQPKTLLDGIKAGWVQE